MNPTTSIVSKFAMANRRRETDDETPFFPPSRLAARAVGVRMAERMSILYRSSRWREKWELGRRVRREFRVSLKQATLLG